MSIQTEIGSAIKTSRQKYVESSTKTQFDDMVVKHFEWKILF